MGDTDKRREMNHFIHLPSAVTEEETVIKSSNAGSKRQVAQSRRSKEAGTAKIWERDRCPPKDLLQFALEGGDDFKINIFFQFSYFRI